MFWWDFFGNNLSVVLKFFNVLFRLFLIFLICFIWVRYFISNLGLCLAITAILTFSFEILIRFFLDRRLAKNKLKTEEEKLAEKISSNFIFNPKLAQSYFLKLAKINHPSKESWKLHRSFQQGRRSRKNSSLSLLQLYSNLRADGC